MLQSKIMATGLIERIKDLSWEQVINKDYPSMLPLTSAQDYNLRSVGIMTPADLEEYRTRVLSKPLP